MFLFLLACGGSPSPTDAIQDTETETPKDTGERDPVRDLDPSDLPSSPDPCRAPEVVLVKEIIDGDTLKVEGKWGGETVRLIGIDTPEMNYDNNAPECWAPEALAALEILLLDKWAWLGFDTECEDHFDRTLAYVHRGTEITDFIQRSLLRDGHAEVFKVNPNNNFHPLFEADESYADGKDLGMWGNCP